MSAPSPAPAAVPPPAGRVLHVPVERLFQDWKAAFDRAVVYLDACGDALGVPIPAREALAREAIERTVSAPSSAAAEDAVRGTLQALRALVMERFPQGPRPEGPRPEGPRPQGPRPQGPRPKDPHPSEAALDAFTAWRLDSVLSPLGAPNAAPPTLDRDGRLSSMPPLRRRKMVPEPIERRFLRRLWRRWRGVAPLSKSALRGRALRQRRRQLPWTRIARRRRSLLTVLVLIPSIIASGFMVNVLPQQGSTWLEFAIVVFFGALFGWISIGFWTALFGFFLLVTRRDRFAITHIEPADGAGFHPHGRTAIVMPICEEPVDRVFAGLKVIYQSLERTGALSHFDFFILSDSGDPSTWVREEAAWAEWCRSVGGFDRIFYRRRRVRLERKSGNVADFCRRWGQSYPYMIMLDADSIMAGETLVRLVDMMERHPEAGVIQTAPSAVNRRSLLARVQQFASRVYGPMFAAGLHFWQLGDGQYWGHNAIIRVAAFMDHCALPRLPGKPPLGGEIMSHDFVEAALMGRAGWTLWLAYDLSGSYEEVPSTLLEEMKRDRRWCQGNLQHLRLLFTDGLFGAHRALFVNGVLSYVSALLWFAFLTLSTAEAVQNALREPEYFPHGRSLFPEWPIWRPDWAFYLMAVTAMILFLPKVLSVFLIVVKNRTAPAYGGSGRLVGSALLEILLSSLLAPIRMVFHSRFVLQNLLGRTVAWGSQGREDAETGWAEALRYHGLDSLFASAWGTGLYWLNPGYFWWLTPIIGALILSVPTSVWASRVGLGARARARGLFLIPEEAAPPRELRDLDVELRRAQESRARIPACEHDGLVRAAVDPGINALRRALLGRRRSLKPAIRAARGALLERALGEGPAALTVRERKMLLYDPEMVAALHEAVWALAVEQAARWGRPGSEKPPENELQMNANARE